MIEFIVCLQYSGVKLKSIVSDINNWFSFLSNLELVYENFYVIFYCQEIKVEGFNRGLDPKEIVGKSKSNGENLLHMKWLVQF